MSEENWVFLETTIAYELHFYTEERRNELESQLRGKKGTSYELEPACVQRKKECEICAFWRQHESELRAIAAALKSAHRLDKSQQRMLARIEKVLDFGMIRARGFRSCRALSDAVIGTEMPRTATLMTMNKRHFELLCSALEKKLFN